MPYFAPDAAIPMTSCAPRLAEMKARPQTQAGMERPARKKSVLVRVYLFSATPMPRTKMKYTIMMIQSIAVSMNQSSYRPYVHNRDHVNTDSLVLDRASLNLFSQARLLRDSQQEHAMSRNSSLVFPAHCSQIAGAPHVSNLDLTIEPQLAEINMHVHGLGMAIEQSHCPGTVRKGTSPNFGGTFYAHALTLHAPGVLVHGNHFAIGQKADRLGRHFGEIVAGEQRRGEHSPHAQVRAGVDGGETSVAYFHH